MFLSPARRPRSRSARRASGGEQSARFTPPLWAPAASSGPPLAADGTPGEHKDQDQYPGDRQDDAQTRDVAREVGRDVGERHAGDVHEGGSYDCSQERQEYRDHQGQQGHQEAVLGPGAARHASRD